MEIDGNSVKMGYMWHCMLINHIRDTHTYTHITYSTLETQTHTRTLHIHLHENNSIILFAAHNMQKVLNTDL